MGYEDLTPEHYLLELAPDIAGSAFTGAVEIRVSAKKSVDMIEMDCAELRITSCVLFAPADDSSSNSTQNIKIPDSLILTDEKSERLIIRLPRGVRIRGTATVRIEFEGVLNDRLLGFYRSTYVYNGTTKHLATTQFEAADARRAFPCWDRPDAKATFELRVDVSDPHHTAISNMPVSCIKTRGRRVRTFYFEPTPPMSTYLVYVGVGEFATATSTYRTGRSEVLIRAITTKAIPKNATRFALDCATRLLGLYESYFGIRYPLPKLDLIAVPDFAAGAMENWGAITFRENLLLFYPRSSSMRTKQRVAEVISHELAHQWFGNLVTMKWWNDLWLNESFATYMATKLLDDAYPEWDLWGQFLTDALRTGMDLDSLQSTHPIDVPVESPEQIREIFDPISYEKGGCILRMLEGYVGSENFRQGLGDYLKKYEHKNATGGDLWACVEAASAKPVASMMRSWLSIPGFPLVSLEMSKNGTILHARQERYAPSAGDNSGRKTKRQDTPAGASRGGRMVWPIPLALRALDRHHTDISHMLDSRTSTIELPAKRDRRHLISANVGRTGFYRVSYSGDMLLDMRLMADACMLGRDDVWGLENDLFAMCMSGRSHIRDYLEVAHTCSKTVDYAVLADIVYNLSNLYGLTYGGGPAHDVICTHAARVCTRIFDDVAGWRPKKHDPPVIMLLRAPVILLLGRLGHPDVIKESKYIGQEIDAIVRAGSRGQIPGCLVLPDLIETVHSVAAWHAGSRKDADKLYESLMHYHNTAESTEEKMRHLGAMCGFGRPEHLARTLDFALSDAVRSQDAFAPIVRVSENPCGRGMHWPWVRDNWDEISAKIGRGNPLLGRVVGSLANSCSESDMAEVLQFFETNPVPGTERTLLQTAEKTGIREAMRRRLDEDLGSGADYNVDGTLPWDVRLS